MSEKDSFRPHRQDSVRMHMWDWKGQPNFVAITSSMRTLFDGTHCPKIISIPNTGRDEYVVLVTGSPLMADEAQELWDNWDWEYEESVGRA